MKLATVKDGSRDGRLFVVSKDLTRAIPPDVPTLQAALDSWPSIEAHLRKLSGGLDAGLISGTVPFRPEQAAPPLPRAYQWVDGSAFPSHGKLMMRAFNLPEDLHDPEIPLMYQGASDSFLGALDDVPVSHEADGIDFEGEIGVIVDDVPMGVAADEAAEHIKLLTMVNDWSLRAHARREMDTGFGFFHAKPASSFSPVVVTPDELGAAWKQERLHLPLAVDWNGERFGNPNAGEMAFSFAELIAYAARTRRLGAGTIVGSGTVSNADPRAGSATITERRALEIIEAGQPKTAFMKFGDRVRLEVLDPEGRSIFGAIDQRVVRYTKSAIAAAKNLGG
jgi:fumarylacetoacetate (FAA) hydrolase